MDLKVLILFTLLLFLTLVSVPDKTVGQLIETEDIEFTKCSCDSSIYCLTDDQYTVLMAQLSARKK